MRYIETLVLTLIVVLASSSAFPALPDLPFSSHPAQRRSLRASTAPKVEGINENSAERGLGKHIKVRWWLESEAPDAYVKKMLKLNGLDNAALKAHKNYKYYAYFARKSEDYLLNKWLRTDITTFDAWKNLKLDRITHRNQLNQVENTENFRVYSRYVKQFNANVASTLDAGYTPRAVMVARGSTDAEMTARTLIMAKAGIDDKVAKVLLGMTVPGHPTIPLRGNDLMKHVDYKFFTLFWKKKAKVTPGK
ncbi:hypothetical protein AM587_10004336 [Phytophthora nicotianae]|uniref:RxLR effector protein n=1 Tax=Phytophthora nicotianae TaxID=4792 RepID=A0A0W8CEW7_PHYNI|nr:hypothetical protein AM587_10004336 [Phytophthora nicotianae]